MSPNIPISALAILGPNPTPASEEWGGVPWSHGAVHSEPLHGLRDGSVTVFADAPRKAVIAVTNGENDLDGPPDGPGGWRVDPDGEPHTSLRDIHGVSCDSRTFRGVVMSPALEALGIKLGDFVLVVYNGRPEWGQVYDIGPTRKQGEFSLYLGRLTGLVPANWSDHHAAIEGHDAEDVCTVFFPGSGPGHALEEAALIAGARACWHQFTGRDALPPVPSLAALVAELKAAGFACPAGPLQNNAAFVALEKLAANTPA